MQESGAVRDAVARFYERISAGDAEGTAATIADDPGAFVIGTQRIGSGREAWLESVRENAEMGVRFEGGDVRGFAEGDAGWAVDDDRASERDAAPDAHDGRPAPRAGRRVAPAAPALLVGGPGRGRDGRASAWREQLGLAAAA